MKLSRSIHSIIHTIPIGHKVIVDDSDALILSVLFSPLGLVVWYTTYRWRVREWFLSRSVLGCGTRASLVSRQCRANQWGFRVYVAENTRCLLLSQHTFCSRQTPHSVLVTPMVGTLPRSPPVSISHRWSRTGTFPCKASSRYGSVLPHSGSSPVKHHENYIQV